MKLENRQARMRQIEMAAFQLLQEQGYKATSMLAIAKRAGASNETLYNWYGNKQALFRSLIKSNAQQIIVTLQDGLNRDEDLQHILERAGFDLLKMVTGEKAVVLNRAAATDANETGSLGEALADAGRNHVMPVLQQIFKRAKNKKQIHYENSGEIVDFYICLLLGDTQIRRVTGTIPELNDKEIKSRVDRAWNVLKKLHCN